MQQMREEMVNISLNEASRPTHRYANRQLMRRPCDVDVVRRGLIFNAPGSGATPSDRAGPQSRHSLDYRAWKFGRRRSPIALVPSLKSAVLRNQSCSSYSRSVARATASARPRRSVSRVAMMASGAD
jgi:hypothetical protein